MEPEPTIEEPPEQQTLSVSSDTPSTSPSPSWSSTNLAFGDAISSVRRIFEESHYLDMAKTYSEPDLVMDLLQDVSIILVVSCPSLPNLTNHPTSGPRPWTILPSDLARYELPPFACCKTYLGHLISFQGVSNYRLFGIACSGIAAGRLSFGRDNFRARRLL